MRTTLFILLMLPIICLSQSPGGVTGPRAWYKADAGVTGSAPISALADQSGNGLNLVQSGTVGPSLTTNSMNYNPGMTFTNNMLKRSAPGIFVNASTITNLNTYVVYNETNNAAFQWMMYNGCTPASNRFSISANFSSDGKLYFDEIPGTNRLIYPSWSPGNQLIMSNLSSTTAISGSNKMMGFLNGANIINNTSFTSYTSPNLIFQLGDNDSIADNANSPFVGSIQEVIVYTTANSIAQRQQIESYLGLKYGVTLDRTGSSGQYVNSSGTAIYSDGGVSTYWNNIIGIGRDDGSGLTQRQSHQSDDATRIYLSTLASNNSTNAGTFSDGQFVMVGNNAATIATNASNTEYPTGVGILNRIDREWKITNTAFTGTFSMDITPSSGFNPSCVRLLVDDDGNFSNGGTTMYAPTVTYTGGVITVSGITTQMIPANTTKYVTLAIVPLPGGVGAQTLWLKADAGITQSGGAVSQWDDVSGDDINLVQATSTKQPVLTTDTLNYYPVPAFDAVDDELTDATVSANALMSVTNGSSTNTTGSIFTVGKVKSVTAERLLMFQWNSVAASNFYSGIGVTTGSNIEIGGRSWTVGFNTLPNLNPFMASCLETPGASNGAHYLNGGKEILTTNPTRGVNTASAGQFLKVGASMNGYVAEAITYRTKLTDLQRRQVESYLALKYAITLDTTTNGNGSTVYGDYISSNGITTWDASIGNYVYHHNVIGIGRDDSTALYQKQSHQLDDSTRIYISSLTSTNTANAGTFSSDGQFVLMGNNGLALQHINNNAEYPGGLNIFARIDREWKITNSNFSGTFSLDIKLHTSPIIDADLRILVDDDGNFNNATMYHPAMSYSGGVITITGITTAMIPVNSTKYLTIVSLSYTTPLPIKLKSFTAKIITGKRVQLDWQTATEINNSFFTIERSANGTQWEGIGRINGAGNSTQLLSYSFIDQNPIAGVSYYRIKQTDIDRHFSYSPVRIININVAAEKTFAVYPNPTADQVTLEIDKNRMNGIIIYDAVGRDVSSYVKSNVMDNSHVVMNLTRLIPGVYIIRSENASVKVYKK